MSDIIDFYRGERPITNSGSGIQYTLDEIIAMSDDSWEVFHDFIQWIFPLKEPSQFNCDAPLLSNEDIHLFQMDNQLKDRFYDAMVRGFHFFGLDVNIVDSGGVGPWCSTFVLEWRTDTENPKWWLQAFNHNWLRVTRFITCMRLVGFEHWAIGFFEKLNEEPVKTISENSWNYWHDATYSPLNL